MKTNRKVPGFLKELFIVGLVLIGIGIVLWNTQSRTGPSYYLACIVIGGLFILVALVDLILKKKAIKKDGGVNLKPNFSYDLEDENF